MVVACALDPGEVVFAEGQVGMRERGGETETERERDGKKRHGQRGRGRGGEGGDG